MKLYGRNLSSSCRVLLSSSCNQLKRKKISFLKIDKFRGGGVEIKKVHNKIKLAEINQTNFEIWRFSFLNNTKLMESNNTIGRN